MSARVRIELDSNGSALLVPEQAIVPMGEQKNVYTVVQGKAKLVPVTIGMSFGTVLTLFVVPVVYTLLARTHKPIESGSE